MKIYLDEGSLEDILIYSKNKKISGFATKLKRNIHSIF